MGCRVKIYKTMNEYQKELFDAGFNLIWQAMDQDCEPVYESKDLQSVIAHANQNDNVTYITKYIKE